MEVLIWDINFKVVKDNIIVRIYIRVSEGQSTHFLKKWSWDFSEFLQEVSGSYRLKTGKTEFSWKVLILGKKLKNSFKTGLFGFC